MIVTSRYVPNGSVSRTSSPTNLWRNVLARTLLSGISFKTGSGLSVGSRTYQFSRPSCGRKLDPKRSRLGRSWIFFAQILGKPKRAGAIAYEVISDDLKQFGIL